MRTLLMALLVPVLLIPAAPAAAAGRPRPLSEVVSTRNVHVAECKDNVFLTSLANGRIVTAELGYSGGDNAMLRARSASVGPWEKFSIACPSYCFLLSQANSRYTTAELGYSGSSYGELRARATTIGPWEQFS